MHGPYFALVRREAETSRWRLHCVERLQARKAGCLQLVGYPSSHPCLKLLFVELAYIEHEKPKAEAVLRVNSVSPHWWEGFVSGYPASPQVSVSLHVSSFTALP